MKKRVVIIIVLVTIAVMLLVRLHVIKYERSDGELLWNDDEAYLFMREATSGYRPTVLELVIEPLREYFYAPALPSENTSSFTVTRITPSGVEDSETIPPLHLARVTPLRGGIYAECLQSVCKWSGKEFQVISKEDADKIGGESRLTREDFSNVNGWSRHEIRSSLPGQNMPPYTFSAGLNHGTKLVVSGYNPVSIDLVRSGRPSDRIWYHKQETRIVSMSEYQRRFQQP